MGRGEEVMGCCGGSRAPAAGRRGAAGHRGAAAWSCGAAGSCRAVAWSCRAAAGHGGALRGGVGALRGGGGALRGGGGALRGGGELQGGGGVGGQRLEELRRKTLGPCDIKLVEVIHELCRWRVESGDIKGISAEDFTDFYLGGRDSKTITGYEGAFKLVRNFARECDTAVFDWGEGEVAGMVVRLAKDKKGENMLKKTSAVVNMVCEAYGKEAPTKSGALKLVKKTAVKRMNKEKERRTSKKPMTMRMMEKMIKEIYLKGSKVDNKSKQCLALMTLLFFGVKRFSDLNKIKVKDLQFKKDGGVEVWVRASKTDAEGRGKVFRISGQEKGGVSVAKILVWYMKSLGLRSEDYFFCKLGRKGEALGSDFIKYHEARTMLEREQQYLGIHGLTLHSCRVGGATEASEEGVSRVRIKEAGGWKSDAVDLYIHSKNKGKEVSRALVNALRL